MPQRPNVRRKQKRRRARKLAEWRRKNEQRTSQSSAPAKNAQAND